MSLTFLAKSSAYSWKMSLAGQVLCQRMLVTPCALTITGAATEAAAPTAAVLRKRRRVDAPSLLVLVISPPQRSAIRCGPPLDFVRRRQRLAPDFGKNVPGLCDASTRLARKIAIMRL